MCPSTQACAEFIDHLASAVSSLGTLFALVVGAGWAWWHFYRRRDLHPKVDFTVGIEFLGQQPGSDHIVVQVIADLTNSGQVRHEISEITYSLRVLRLGDPVRAGGQNILEQLEFPTKVVSNRRFFPESWVHTFVDPGVKNSYRSVTTIPADTRLVLATAWFAYASAKDSFHRSERVFRVPEAVVRDRPCEALVSDEVAAQAPAG
jgi:hypothetical protein